MASDPKNEKILNTSPTPNSKQFVVQVEEKFFSEVENHVRVLQYLNNAKISKKEWVAKAVEEKLDRAEDIDIKNLPKERNINVFLDDAVHKKLEKRISLLKKFISISKRQLVIEAITEKLEREADIVKNCSSKLKNNFH